MRPPVSELRVVNDLQLFKPVDRKSTTSSFQRTLRRAVVTNVMLLRFNEFKDSGDRNLKLDPDAPLVIEDEITVTADGQPSVVLSKTVPPQKEIVVAFEYKGRRVIGNIRKEIFDNQRPKQNPNQQSLI